MTIKLILSDIDGCICPGVGQTLNLSKMDELKKVVQASEVKLTFCTGRPKPYTEAIMQMMGVHIPAVCENGGIIYNPATLKMIYPAPDALAHIPKIVTVLNEHIIGELPAFVEPSKFAAVGIIPDDINDSETTAELCKRIELSRKLFPCDIHYNLASNVVNVLPLGISKAKGFSFLLDLLKISPEETLAIGDSNGDLEFMQLCRYRACPANSTKEVKAISGFVSTKNDIEGVLEIAKNHNNQPLYL